MMVTNVASPSALAQPQTSNLTGEQEKWFACFAVLIPNIIAAAQYWNVRELDLKPWYVVIVLLAPGVVVFLMTLQNWKLIHRYGLLLGACLFVGFVWIAYTNMLSGPDGRERKLGMIAGFLSVVCLLASMLVSIYVVYVTHLMLKKKKRNPFRDDAREKPILVLFIFLSMFVYLAILLSFALAFHDKSSETPALYGTLNDQEALPPEALAGRQGHPERSARPATQQGASKADGQQGEPRRIYRILFEENSAELGIDQGANLVGMDGPMFEQLHGENRLMRQAKVNFQTISEICQEIVRHQRVRVIIVGHANRPGVKPGNREVISNFEMSHLRATVVQLAIYLELSRKYADRDTELEIDWHTLPASSVGPLFDKEAKKKLEPIANKGKGDEKLAAEVEVVPQKRAITQSELEGVLAKALAEHATKDEIEDILAKRLAEQNRSRPLGLLDYLYFVTYTITTTGYGDLVPMSHMAKFITMLANSYEVLFLVIFINVLIMRMDGKKGNLVRNRQAV